MTRLAVLLALATACTVAPLPVPVPPPDPEPLPPAPDPQPIDPAEACQAAEDTLKWLQCMRPDGQLWHVGFGQACTDAYQDGRNWNPQCIRAIESCEALEAAYRGELCPGN